MSTLTRDVSWASAALKPPALSRRSRTAARSAVAGGRTSVCPVIAGLVWPCCAPLCATRGP
ncbi:hypothetical protein ACGFYV_34360 [Streptomyces sp. NPDC048297]|uniref:hypothetical protein n=1 Tax=Streptomyces sp. NPDC048297 TaxID=3365531 RepID=UPI003722DDE1